MGDGKSRAKLTAESARDKYLPRWWHHAVDPKVTRNFGLVQFSPFLGNRRGP
jgi:hypothetical protein